MVPRGNFRQVHLRRVFKLTLMCWRSQPIIIAPWTSTEHQLWNQLKSKDVLELMRFLKDVRTKHPKGRIISMSELTRDLVQEEKALLSKDSDSKYFAVFWIYRGYRLQWYTNPPKFSMRTENGGFMHWRNFKSYQQHWNWPEWRMGNLTVPKLL